MATGASRIGGGDASPKACFGACQCCRHPWCFGSVWHPRSDADIATAAILGRTQLSNILAWQFCGVLRSSNPPRPADCAVCDGNAVWCDNHYRVYSGNQLAIFTGHRHQCCQSYKPIFEIGIIVGVVNVFLRLMPTDNNPPHSVEPNKLLARIPRAKRGDLISLTVMDHYVEVTTTRGKHLMLMRFSDALAEIPSGISLQVHLSYWVAHAQIEGHIHNGKRLLLITSAQDEIPVSSSFRKAVRAMGVGPSKGR